MSDRARPKILMAALMAPAAGLLVVSGLGLLLYGPGQRAMTGLFYILLVGAPVGYSFEFLAIWYFRERLKGGQLALRRLLPIAACLGFLSPIIPIYGFRLVEPMLSWTTYGAVGAVGGIVAALTFRFLAPPGRPAQ